MTTATANALHAAETWLARLGAEPSMVAVVNTLPTAAVGLWQRGAPNIAMLPMIDDAAAELCEAVAAAVEVGLRQLEDGGASALQAATTGQARLQTMLCPASGEIGLRLLQGDKCIELATLIRDDLTH